MKIPKSWFDKTICRPRSKWRLLGIGVFFFSMPLLASLADRGFDTLIKPSSRGLFIPPTILIYILIIAPRTTHSLQQLLKTFRPIVLLEDEEFQALVFQATRIKGSNEFISILLGALIGFGTSLRSISGQFSWLNLYWVLLNILMYGLISWTVYVSLAGTKLTNTLLRQPLNIDPFDTTPFQPIGRQSFFNALVFIGGITLSLLFIKFDFSILQEALFWLIYGPLTFIPILIFFMTMAPTHRALANAKNLELEAVQLQLRKSCRQLMDRLEKKQETENLPDEINALATYEQHLQNARTWPYNTAMLRTLFFSVFFPLVTILGRLVVEALY